MNRRPYVRCRKFQRLLERKCQHLLKKINTCCTENLDTSWSEFEQLLECGAGPSECIRPDTNRSPLPSPPRPPPPAPGHLQFTTSSLCKCLRGASLGAEPSGGLHGPIIVLVMARVRQNGVFKKINPVISHHTPVTASI